MSAIRYRLVRLTGSCDPVLLIHFWLTDEEIAKYLVDVFPGLDIVQIRGSLLRARKPGSTQSQGFTATVAEALGLLGLR